jgi:hypothetical protein
LAAAVAVGASVGAVDASAEPLVVGDLLAIESRATSGRADGALSLDRFDASRDSASFALPFTPRNPLSLIFGQADGPGAEPAEVRLSVTRSRSQAERLASLGPAANHQPGTPARTLEIGGALRWSDWTVGSGYARAPLFGGEADLLSASLGYGRVQARLAYGQADTGAADTLDVLMLSTDLAAWSWLTLESDVALGSGESRTDEAMAVGRLGVRLNF